MSFPSNIDESGAAVESETDLSGRTLGDYQLIRQLGAGGMSNVYLAEQLSLRRKVALKVLKRRLSQDASYVRRFHREAQAAAKLVHANIVQIYEVGERDGYHYIAQEYVPGRNLKQVLDRDGVVKARPAVGIMRRVLAALKKAGDEGITHRDIKPENIMIAPNGDVKVADFGLARIDEDKGVDLTQIGVTMGTPLYMSPEQVEGRHVDRRSDLYSLGVSCYHMLAGRPPFEGDTPLSIAVQHLKDAPKRLESLRKDLPEGLCRIVHRMLEKDPAARYASAAEALKALRGVPLEEGADEWTDMDVDGEDLGTRELAALSATRMASTQRLETLMHASEKATPVRRALPWAVLLVLLAAAMGAAAGWATYQPLLSVQQAPNPSEGGIPRMESAEAQFVWSQMMLLPGPAASDPQVSPEDALLSVERLFSNDAPENRYYIQRARLRLAEYYLEQDRFEDAMAAFRQVSSGEDLDLKFRALIGQLLVHWRRDRSLQDENAASLLIQVKELAASAPRVRAEIYRDLRRMDDGFRQQVWELLSSYVRPQADPNPQDPPSEKSDAANGASES